MPPLLAAENSAMPSGMPASTPGMADSTWAATTPAVTCSGLAPSARATAEAWRASSTVAHAVHTALSPDRASSTTVTTSSIWVSRAMTGSIRPLPLPNSFSSAVAWNASTVTTPVMVIAMQAALSSARRGRRATRRSPNSSGTGRWRDSRISPARRRGRRTGSASALTVLVRAARMAGHSVAAMATTRATPTTSPAVGSVSDGAPGAPTRPAPGLVISGAASRPMASPAMAAASARIRFSAISASVTMPGVAPTALSRPTRRMRSDIRPPASTARVPMASSVASQAPGFSTAASSRISRPSTLRMSCHVVRLGAVDVAEFSANWWPYRFTNAWAWPGSLSFRFST